MQEGSEVIAEDKHRQFAVPLISRLPGHTGTVMHLATAVRVLGGSGNCAAGSLARPHVHVLFTSASVFGVCLSLSLSRCDADLDALAGVVRVHVKP